MKLTLLSLTLALALAASSPTQDTYLGCFTNPGSLTDQGPNTYQSTGLCSSLCTDQDAKFFALKGEHCYCGDIPPAKIDAVSDAQCSTQCPGFPAAYCMNPLLDFGIWQELICRRWA